jgi:hypothetical protein
MRTEPKLIDELRREIVRLRAALAEAMDWSWGNEPPPADVVERLEVALGLPDESRPILRQAPSILRDRPERLSSPVAARPLPKSA